MNLTEFMIRKLHNWNQDDADCGMTNGELREFIEEFVEQAQDYELGILCDECEDIDLYEDEIRDLESMIEDYQDEIEDLKNEILELHEMYDQ